MDGRRMSKDDVVVFISIILTIVIVVNRCRSGLVSDLGQRCGNLCGRLWRVISVGQHRLLRPLTLRYACLLHLN